MHGRKKSDLPQTKEEKDAVQAKISNYNKVSEMGGELWPGCFENYRFVRCCSPAASGFPPSLPVISRAFVQWAGQLFLSSRPSAVLSMDVHFSNCVYIFTYSILHGTSLLQEIEVKPTRVRRDQDLGL